MKHGWALPEMLVALTVTSVIAALAAAAGIAQLRTYRGIGDVAAVRTQVAQAALIAANVLRDVPTREHILVAMDSVIEVAATTATSFTCGTDTGRVVVARAKPTGFTLAAFAETPRPGDDVEILALDSTISRLRASVAAEPAAVPCPRFPDAGGWSIALAEPFVVHGGMPVRFTRRHRLGTYRASDGQWYLGLKDWNAALARFNTIQPVAGPLLPQGGSPPGLRFEYRDARGVLLATPEPASIAIVTVLIRGDTPRPVRVSGMRATTTGVHRDSATISIAIR